jgi:hypothetical protein
LLLAGQIYEIRSRCQEGSDLDETSAFRYAGGRLRHGMEQPQQGEIPSVLRSLSMAELLDRTFSLYRHHFLLFFGIAAVPALIKFVSLLLGDWLESLIRTFFRGSAIAWVVLIILVIAVLLLYLTTFVMSQAATMFAVAGTYLQQPIPIREAYIKSMPHLRPLFWLIVQTSLRIGLGFVLLVIPGILLTLNYSVSVPVAIFEDLRGTEALDRSTWLTQGYRGRIFVFYFVFWLIGSIENKSLQYLAKIIPGTFWWSTAFPQLIDLLSSTFIDPLLLIALALVYYDLRVRKEAFDLEFMMASLDSADHQTQTARA